MRISASFDVDPLTLKNTTFSQAAFKIENVRWQMSSTFYTFITEIFYRALDKKK